MPQKRNIDLLQGSLVSFLSISVRSSVRRSVRFLICQKNEINEKERSIEHDHCAKSCFLAKGLLCNAASNQPTDGRTDLYRDEGSHLKCMFNAAYALLTNGWMHQRQTEWRTQLCEAQWSSDLHVINGLLEDNYHAMNHGEILEMVTIEVATGVRNKTEKKQFLNS